MLERLRTRLDEIRGKEHIKGGEVVDEALEIGDPDELRELRGNEHPTIRRHYSSSKTAFLRQHPELILDAAAVIGSGISLILAYRKVQLHRQSAEQIRMETVQAFVNPLSVPFEEACQIGETAVKQQLGNVFISNLCDSSVQNSGNEASESDQKRVADFWNQLNPYHAIFEELLEPETRYPRHSNPTIQPVYQGMINKMTESIAKTNQELSTKINKDIQNKLDKRRGSKLDSNS